MPIGVFQALWAFGKRRSSDKKARNQFPRLHATQTSATLLYDISKKPEIEDTHNVQSQAARILG